MPLTPEVESIIARTGMREYVPPPSQYSRAEESRKKRREPASVRTRNIGHFSIMESRTNGTGIIRLYENLEGWKRKLRAIWSGFGKFECDKKFDEIVEAVIQVRFEHKMGRI